MKKLLSYLILFVKGAIMGIANVIPGVSGGTLAVILGIYDKFISAISGIFKNFIKNVLYLLPIVLGMGVAILLSSKVIGDSLENFPFATGLFFNGLIIGGIPLLYKKIKGHIFNVPNILIFVSIFAFLLLYTFLPDALGFIKNEIIIDEYNFDILGYIKLFLVGIIGAATMIIPGISGSMTLMILGYYEMVVGESVGNITNFSMIVPHLQVLIPFALGCIVGILLISKLIEIMLKKFEVKTFFGIFGFIFASIIIIFVKNIPETWNIWEIIIGIGLFIVGLACSYFISKFQKDDKADSVETNAK